MLIHQEIDMKKALNKWTPVVESLGLNVNTEIGAEKARWMAEYAEIHAYNESAGRLQENVGYVNMQTISGMGPVVSPQPGAIPGTTGTAGSGDLGQNLLTTAMKIAYQTIGLDLVAVKPASGSKIDLVYNDYRYDDSPLTGDTEKPQLFQVPVYEAMRLHLQRLIDENTSPTKRMFVAIEIADAAAGPTAAIHSPIQEGGLNGVKSEYTTADVAAETYASALTLSSLAPTTAATAGSQTVFYLEFIGFSIYTGNAIFRSYRQLNTASSGAGVGGAWAFDYSRNSFPTRMNVASALGAYIDAVAANSRIAYLRGSFSTVHPVTGGTEGQAPIPVIQDATTLAAGTYRPDVALVSVLEDHVEGYAANWNKTAPMTRAEDEYYNPGTIGVNFFTKTVQTGVVEVSAAVKRNEIEDIKAATGIDIVQKLEAVLVNELSQTISKHIVGLVKELGRRNRATAPKVLRSGAATALPAKWGGFETLFDFDVDKMIDPAQFLVSTTNSNYRENAGSFQRKLVSKINTASTYILQQGRYGAASYIVTSGRVAALLTDNAGFVASPYASSMDAGNQLYPAGTLGKMVVYVDPYQDLNDTTVYLGRKNSIEQPGIVFVPYLMAQSLSLISEATRAPRLFLRSRYAVTEIGFYPEKQFMSLMIRDSNNILL